MVKRCGKSAPREAQATRHGKPRRVQDQIGNPGAARSGSAKADGFRVLVAETNDSLRRKAQTKFGLQPFQNHYRIFKQSAAPAIILLIFVSVAIFIGQLPLNFLCNRRSQLLLNSVALGSVTQSRHMACGKSDLPARLNRINKTYYDQDTFHSPDPGWCIIYQY